MRWFWGPAAARVSLLLGAALGLPLAVQAQAHDHPASGGRFLRAGAQVLLLGTHATPADRGRDLTEVYLTQPNIFLHFQRDWLAGQATINLEGLTLRRGELNAGAWGEGYIDRRHPHNYLHEAVVTTAGTIRAVQWSISGGKGFAPFGTDDPMVRPFLKFPANHHLAHVLERLVLIGAVRYGPLVLEAGWFNGDEPAGPESLVTFDRFRDSWAARATLRPWSGIELQASRALVESPEQPEGDALDHGKWDISLRHAGAHQRGGHQVLLEWARTAKLHNGEEVVALHSLLAEGALQRGDWRTGLRFERTVRPEEERAGSIFRSPWPPADQRIWGLTRWVIVTGNTSYELDWKGLRLAPTLEISRQWARHTREPFFVPAQLFGSDRLWSITLALRLSAGLSHDRMGRYGVAQ